MSSQLTLNFEPTLPERWPSLREYIAYRAQVANKHMKVQAADMDMAPSTLARKLNPSDGDTQRLNCDDLEAWIQSTGEASAVVEYLAPLRNHFMQLTWGHGGRSSNGFY